jgi:hypothetical protein
VKAPFIAIAAVGQLLKLCQSKRLGNGKGGCAGIIKHKWFSGFDWDGLLACVPGVFLHRTVPYAGDTTVVARWRIGTICARHRKSALVQHYRARHRSQTPQTFVPPVQGTRWRRRSRSPSRCLLVALRVLLICSALARACRRLFPDADSTLRWLRLGALFFSLITARRRTPWARHILMCFALSPHTPWLLAFLAVSYFKHAHRTPSQLRADSFLAQYLCRVASPLTPTQPRIGSVLATY